SQPPGGANLVFSLQNNYLQLPEYLGGGMLGSAGENLTIDLYANVANLLNGLKTLTLNDLIRAIPMQYRVGQQAVSVAGLSLNAAWAITTPSEFVAVAYKHLKISADQKQDLAAVLPAKAGKEDQGLVVFLKGGFSILNTAEFAAVFA